MESRKIMVFKLVFIFSITILLSSVSPVAIISASEIQSVSFRYSYVYGGSIIVRRCTTGEWNWLTTTEMTPDSFLNRGVNLGSWKWNESGCVEHYAVTSIGDTGYFEIGIGSGDEEPQDNSYSEVGTKIYRVTYNGTEVESELVRTINSSTSWCDRGDCSGYDMQGTPCEKDMKTVMTGEIKGYGGYDIGVLKLMGSASCGTNWAVVNVYGENPTYVRVQITREKSDSGHWHNNLSYDVIGLRTYMIYAPEEPVMACGLIEQDEYTTCVSQK